MKKVGEVYCEEGVIEEEIKIRKLDIDWEDESIIAQIEFGNVYVVSPGFVETTGTE
ncbi:MAG: hypothetical protein U9N86_07810 [Bacteroidota bacterium]|nr:hypothetical protein [Bacteroidota bacterium]